MKLHLMISMVVVVGSFLFVQSNPVQKPQTSTFTNRTTTFMINRKSLISMLQQLFQIIFHEASSPTTSPPLATHTPITNLSSFPSHFSTGSNSQFSTTLSLSNATSTTKIITTTAPNFKCASDNQIRRVSNLVGGEEANGEKWSFLVQIYIYGRYVCGGSLINHEWVLSATHCFVYSSGEQKSAKYVRVKFGAVSLNRVFDEEDDELSNIRKVSQIFLHPKFDKFSLTYDFALLKLEAKVESKVGSICWNAPVQKTKDSNNALFFGGEKDTKKIGDTNSVSSDAEYRAWDLNKVCFFAGFGRNDGGSTRLQEARIQIGSTEECVNFINKVTRLPKEEILSEFFSESMFCGIGASNPKGFLASACSGDSGGPVVCLHKNHWVLHGIISFGFVNDRPFHAPRKNCTVNRSNSKLDNIFINKRSNKPLKDPYRKGVLSVLYEDCTNTVFARVSAVDQWIRDVIENN